MRILLKGVQELLFKKFKQNFFYQFLFATLTTEQNKPHSKLKHKQTKTNKNKIKNRPKWVENNSLELYHKYFFVFSHETFNTFSYLSEYLAPIYYNQTYENYYFELFDN